MKVAVILATISQLNNTKVLQTIAFDSYKLIQAIINPKIQNKELLGILWPLEKWGSCLLSPSQAFETSIDHETLKSLMSNGVLTCLQARWAVSLAKFDFTGTYQRDKLNIDFENLSPQSNF